MKNIVKKITAAVLAVFCVFAFYGCLNKESAIDMSISELRLDIYEGRGEFFDVSIYIGKRESPYVLDGISEKLVDYCLINVMPAEELEEGYGLHFTLTGGKYNESGTLAEDPATGKFRADLGKYYGGTEELNITFNCGEIYESVTLHSRYKSDMIKWKDALEVAKENLAQSFSEAYSGKEFNGEIFIRFVNNPIMGEDKYYWFVMLRDRNGKMSTVLIDSIDSKVVARNVT
jgi:hypothetical protein